MAERLRVSRRKHRIWTYPIKSNCPIRNSRSAEQPLFPFSFFKREITPSIDHRKLIQAEKCLPLDGFLQIPLS